MHKVFISYRHKIDQVYKESLLSMNKLNNIFIDGSVETGDISDELTDEEIRKIIRDEYLQDTTVTILLVGAETSKRKHIDWEIYSSMYDGMINKKSGILVINLPYINCTCSTASHSGEKEKIYSEVTDWITIDKRTEYEKRYPYMPERIIDNLLKKEAKISVVNWSKIDNNPDYLSFLIDATYNDRAECLYDLSRKMRKNDS